MKVTLFITTVFKLLTVGKHYWSQRCTSFILIELKGHFDMKSGNIIDLNIIFVKHT